MQTVADMRGVGVKNRGKSADILCGRPLTESFTAKNHVNFLVFSIAKRTDSV